jgi:hypothetical protein
MKTAESGWPRYPLQESYNKIFETSKFALQCKKELRKMVEKERGKIIYTLNGEVIGAVKAEIQDTQSPVEHPHISELSIVDKATAWIHSIYLECERGGEKCIAQLKCALDNNAKIEEIALRKNGELLLSHTLYPGINRYNPPSNIAEKIQIISEMAVATTENVLDILLMLSKNVLCQQLNAQQENQEQIDTIRKMKVELTGIKAQLATIYYNKPKLEKCSTRQLLNPIKEEEELQESAAQDVTKEATPVPTQLDDAQNVNNPKNGACCYLRSV